MVNTVNSLCLDRDQELTKFALETLKERYLLPGENSPQEAFMRAAKAFSDDEAHAQRIYDYASRFWFMFSTPILSNGGSSRGLPISCYLNHVPDSRQGIADHWKENMFLASQGGGIGADYSSLRSSGESTSRGSKSNGVIPFLKVADSEIDAISQGKTRRGSYAAYLIISHPEIKPFITIRKTTGGDPGRKCQSVGFHNAVVITDAFMEAVELGQSWALVDPHSEKVVELVDARELWVSLIETRMETGEPYFFFIDTVHRLQNKSHKALNLWVNASNLCSEVYLPATEDRTAVCCLSSVNLDKYDEWKHDPLFIEDLIRFLDNVITDFISIAPKELSKAVYSAKRERSLGLGAMGFHSYLQRNNLPFEGPLAKGCNINIFSNLEEKALNASIKLGKEKGDAPDIVIADVEGLRRNTYLQAVAPNASSAILANVSPSIEPWRANAYNHKTLSGSFLVKNPHLETLLTKKGYNNDETWKSIITNKGSVQQLDCLDEWEKSVYKTAIEIDQHWIINHASDRQKFIDQGQSINLFFPNNSHIPYVHSVHWAAWEKGLKGLYYVRSESAQRPELVSKQVDLVEREECFSCQG